MEMHENQAMPSNSLKLPLSLTIVSLFVWFGFQTVQLIIERNSLLSITGSMHESVQEAQKLRTQLETLVTKTAELAKQGNPSARKAVEELEQKGIPIKAEPQQPSKAQPSK
jgi:hypothetical protein